MTIHPLAGKPCPKELLADIPALINAYYELKPDAHQASQKVAFGTSGHRGSSIKYSFNENHILAICQAICDLRQSQGINGPLFMGMDTHALSEFALKTALEVFAANGVETFIQEGFGFTPTPVISHAILTHNAKNNKMADGVVITPSHNGPEDGGFKYNPPNGGPADAGMTRQIQDAANQYLLNNLQGVKRLAYEKALAAPTTHHHDYITPYIQDLENVVDMQAIAASGIHIGVDPLGGSGVAFWQPMKEYYRLNLDVVNPTVDPTFSFMSLDYDGKIRMDCSSPYAMNSLIQLKDGFDIACGNDPDFDRHGIVVPGSGLMNPNHYLAVAIHYLFSRRSGWGADVAVGKTLVSSSLIDRVAADLGRSLCEVPVGFKYFVDGLLNGSLGFGGEESAGASFLRKDGTTWTTDKDGFILDLLAAEILATTGKNPAEHYQQLAEKFGETIYRRMEAPASPAQKKVLSNLSADLVKAESLAGESITARLTHAPCNGAAIGGLKVVTQNGWFAARPSGTEDIYKIYAESFKDETHLQQIFSEAQQIVSAAFAAAGAA